jgi:alanine-glyoxylate transaminase / serine-glyoxylate transaminase / serine-pyruvate transaminase
MSAFHSGHHFLQLPGPSNVPERVLRAMDRAVIDHRGPEFSALVPELLAGMRELCRASGPVVLFPSSGTGAWEAALTNTLNPGDRLLCAETGQFSNQWAEMARKLGFTVDVIGGDWRHGADPEEIGKRLRADRSHAIAGVMIVHSETSTGVCSRLADIRAAISAADHPALLFVDTVSSLATMDYRHDEWGIDVMVSGSQKGLMLPPGMGINVVSAKALAAHRKSRFPRSYFDWTPILEMNEAGFYPYTSPTLLFFGLREALTMILREEGLANTLARHARLAEATRHAVAAWNLELVAQDPREYTNSLTAVLVPAGIDADAIRATILERFDMSLGTCFGKFKGKVFRIGHLGSINELMLAGTLAGVQMGLRLHEVGTTDGVNAALAYLSGRTQDRPDTVAGLVAAR